MAITLIDQKQIRDFSSPTGTWYPTGWLVSGNMAISGLLSGISGYFNNLTVQSITVNGAVISPYLSGIVGTNVTGSGIFVTLSPVDTSGNNIHFYHYIYTNNPASPIQKFSSQDSQTDWQMFNNGTWQSFPALGLDSTQQQTSLVKHVYAATGMNVFEKYFSEYSVIYAGNITGTPANSIQFQSPTVGYTVAHIPFLSEYFATADSRYVRKAQIGSEYVISGAKASGIPIILPTYPAIPVENHGTGTLISISGYLFTYDATITGYRAATPFTGFSVASGGIITASNPIFSGNGTITTRIFGNNIIEISGGGTSGFAIAGRVFQQGGLIFSGGSNVTLTSGTSPSGTIITINSAGGGGNSNVTGFGVNLNSILFTGGFVVSGEGGTSVRLSNLGNNISGIIISGSSSAGGVGNVTGIGVLSAPLFTGGFIITGTSGVRVDITNIAAGLSGIQISHIALTGLGINGGVGSTGYISLSGASNITILQQGTNYVVSGLSNHVTGLGITGSALLVGGISLIGSGTTTLAYSGNNIIIGSSGDTTVNNTINNFFLSGTGGIVSAGISGIPQFTGTLGITGLGGITVSLNTVDTYGFSGLYTISGRTPIGAYYFVFPSTIDTSSNNLIPDLYSNEDSAAFEFAATLKTACEGQSILGFFNKNGSNLFSFEVPTGTTKFTSGVNVSIASGDVVTAGLTRVGSTTAGTTLALSINVR